MPAARLRLRHTAILWTDICTVIRSVKETSADAFELICGTFRLNVTQPRTSADRSMNPAHPTGEIRGTLTRDHRKSTWSESN